MRSVYLGNAERGKLGRREFWRIHKQIMCRKGLSSGVIEHYCKEKEGYKFLGIFMGHTAGGKESLIIQKKQNIILLKGHSDHIWSVTWSPDGKQIVWEF